MAEALSQLHPRVLLQQPAATASQLNSISAACVGESSLVMRSVNGTGLFPLPDETGSNETPVLHSRPGYLRQGPCVKPQVVKNK